MATETTNLKLSKADSSDAIIQTLYANNNNLDIIDENILNLKTESDTKATKAELTVLAEEISGKADISYVDSKEFTLNVATADTLGGIKVGANLAIDEDGTLRAIASSSGDSGDMLKSIYDTDGDGIVDDAEKLGGQLPSYYARAEDLTNVNTTLGNKADTSYVNTEVAKKANTIHSHDISDITNLQSTLDSKAASSHNQAASTITEGTFAGQVNANATAVANVGTAQVRNISAGTTDLTAGTSALATGEIYFVYE